MAGIFSSFPAKRNAVLKNEGSHEDVPCKPTSSNPDVGILSCGMGKYCSESADYDLGGVCVDSSMMEELAHRHLEVNEGLTCSFGAVLGYTCTQRLGCILSRPPARVPHVPSRRVC
jgi:hypothetical protein